LIERREDLEVLANRLILEEVVERDTLDRILGIQRDADGRKIKSNGHANEEHDPLEKYKDAEAAQGADDVDVTGTHH